MWGSLETGSFRLPLPNLISSRRTQVSSQKPSSNLSAPHAFLHSLTSGPVGTERAAGQHLESCLPATSGSSGDGPTFETGSQRPPDSTAPFHNPSGVTATSCANVYADLGPRVSKASASHGLASGTVPGSSAGQSQESWKGQLELAPLTDGETEVRRVDGIRSTSHSSVAEWG